MTETSELHGAALVSWLEGPVGEYWFAHQKGKHVREAHLAHQFRREGIFGDFLGDGSPGSKYTPWGPEILSRMSGKLAMEDGHPVSFLYEPEGIAGLPWVA